MWVVELTITVNQTTTERKELSLAPRNLKVHVGPFLMRGSTLNAKMQNSYFRPANKP